MRPYLFTLVLSLSGFAYENVQGILAVHGGYAPDKPDLTPELKKGFCDGLTAAVRKGIATLETTKSSLEAVQAAVQALEDAPEFNAGKGGLYHGRNE